MANNPVLLDQTEEIARRFACPRTAAAFISHMAMRPQLRTSIGMGLARTAREGMVRLVWLDRFMASP